MENLFTAYEIRSDNYLTSMYFALTEGALSWFYNIARDDPDLTWESFKEQLIQEFTPFDQQIVFHEQLAALRQTGSIDEYVKQFRAIAHHVQETTPRDMMFYFQSGLHMNIRQYLRPISSQDLNKMIAKATSFAHARELASTGSTSVAPSSMEVNFVQNHCNNFHHSGNQGRHRQTPPVGPNIMHSRPPNQHLSCEDCYRLGLCTYCKKPGHFHANCPNKPSGKGRRY